MSKTVVTRIESAVASVSSVLESCLLSKNARQIISDLSSAQVVLDNSLEAIPSRSRTFTSVKKSLLALNNALDGLKTGVENRDLSLGKFRAATAGVQTKFLLGLAESLSQVTLTDDPVEEVGNTEEAGTKLVVRSTDFKSALKTIRGHLEDHFKKKEDDEDAENPVLVEHERSEKAYQTREERDEDRLKERIAHVESLKTQMPLAIKGAYQVMRFPLVPIFDSSILSGKKPTGRSDLVRNFSGSRVLDSLGIRYIMVQDYLILEEQLVLAVNLKDYQEFQSDQDEEQSAAHKANLGRYKNKVGELKRRGLDKDDIPAHVERPKKGKTQVSPLDFAKSILDALNEKAPSKYMLVTQQFVPNPRNTSILFFWIMPRKTLSSLISKNWSKVKNWGFPW